MEERDRERRMQTEAVSGNCLGFSPAEWVPRSLRRLDPRRALLIMACDMCSGKIHPSLGSGNSALVGEIQIIEVIDRLGICVADEAEPL